MVIDLSKHHSLLNHWVAELRDVHVQNDRMRFRRNLERIGEVFESILRVTRDMSNARQLEHRRRISYQNFYRIQFRLPVHGN